jgi:hypothetical protein
MCNYFECIVNKISILQKETIKLSGAAEARRAHNPEDTGSKPVSASSFFAFLLYLTLEQGYTVYFVSSSVSQSVKMEGFSFRRGDKPARGATRFWIWYKHKALMSYMFFNQANLWAAVV